MPKETFYPDKKEPHIHKHKGGVTFTDDRHKHKTLQKGELVYKPACQEVIAEQKNANPRGMKIATWIEANLL